MMLRDGALLTLGGVLLYFGAEWLIRGAAGLAARLHVRPLIIGLTVVAYGTSAPELVVGVGAALTHRGAIAFGNAVGSNIANVGLILGLTAIVSPPKVDGGLRRRELPVMVLSAFALPLLLLDGRISRLEGVGLILVAALYTFVMIKGSRASSVALEAGATELAEDARQAAGAPATSSRARLVVIAFTGLACLLLGGNWLVDGASGLARSFGLSERVVGLTIVAVGTSLPELATSLVAARRGHSDLAVGNVVGSNIFNVLLILGASGTAGTLDVSIHQSRVELGALLVFTVLGAVFLRRERHVRRVEGATLVTMYLAFLLALAFVAAP